MKRVVIVEDDVWLAAHFRRVLERAGFAVIVAHDGVAAIDVIDEAMPDAIVMDVLLGGSTAPALLHELQSHYDLAATPVVLVSNIAERVVEERMQKYGVRRVFDKADITPEQLVMCLREVT